MAWEGGEALSGGCTIAASLVATWHIYKHLCNYTEPMYQRYTIRIIFMIHVYGLMSFLALVKPTEAIYFNSICGIYEAWVIYNFLSLCIAFIGGPGAVATNLQGQYLKPSWHLMTCCCDAIPLDGVFIRRCKQGVLQFVILKPLLVGATLMLYESDLYNDGSFSTSNGYLYVTIVYTFSYTVALAALVLFYAACKDMLQPFQPLPKFLIIKSVVFLTYWQGVVIALLASGGVIKTAQEALDVQNTTICIEMLFAGIGHLYAFPYSVYANANIDSQGDLMHSILHALNFSDLVYDTMHQFAPTYHEYVLYSDGSQEAPQRDQMRTLVPRGPGEEEEMQQVVEQEHSSPSVKQQGHQQQQQPEGAAAGAVLLHMEVGRARAIPPQERVRVTTVGQLMAELAHPQEGGYGTASDAGLSRHLKLLSSSSSAGRSAAATAPANTTPLGQHQSVSNIGSSTINDFNPRALATAPAPRSFRPWLGGSSLDAGSPCRQAWTGSRVLEIRRESNSCPEDEATELTKLTDRRTSEHGSLMDTIDIGGENEEYSEGFIQR